MALKNTGVKDVSCSWLKGSTNHTTTKSSERDTGTSGPIGSLASDTVTVKQSTLKSNKGLMKKHIDSSLGAMTDGISKDLLEGLGDKNKLTATVDLNKKVKENVVDKITSALNEPGVPLKTKSILQKTLGFICDKNGLGFDLDLSLLIKGLGLDALMDLLNCMSDDATIAGRVTKMMDMDVSSVAKNKTLNTVAGGGKLSTKGGLSVLDKQNTKDGIKNGLVDIKPFTHDVANSNKRFGTTDKKRYLEILGDNNDEFISTRREGSSRLVVDDMIEDVSNSRLKSKLVAPIDKDTRNIVKSRLVRA